MTPRVARHQPAATDAPHAGPSPDMPRLPQFGFPGGPVAPPYSDVAGTEEHSPPSVPVDLAGPLDPVQDDGVATDAETVVLRAGRPSSVRVVARIGASTAAIVILGALATQSSPPVVATLLAGVIAAVWLLLVTATALLRPTEVRLVGHWVGVRSPFGQYAWCDLTSVHSVVSVNHPTVRPRARNGAPVALALWSTTRHGPGMSTLVARLLTARWAIPGVQVTGSAPNDGTRPFVVACGELHDPAPLLAAIERHRSR